MPLGELGCLSGRTHKVLSNEPWAISSNGSWVSLSVYLPRFLPCISSVNLLAFPTGQAPPPCPGLREGELREGDFMLERVAVGC
jgi:hypothetical protein